MNLTESTSTPEEIGSLASELLNEAAMSHTREFALLLAGESPGNINLPSAKKLETFPGVVFKGSHPEGGIAFDIRTLKTIVGERLDDLQGVITDIRTKAPMPTEPKPDGEMFLVLQKNISNPSKVTMKYFLVYEGQEDETGYTAYSVPLDFWVYLDGSSSINPSYNGNTTAVTRNSENQPMTNLETILRQIMYMIVPNFMSKDLQSFRGTTAQFENQAAHNEHNRLKRTQTTAVRTNGRSLIQGMSNPQDNAQSLPPLPGSRGKNHGANSSDNIKSPFDDDDM